MKSNKFEIYITEKGLKCNCKIPLVNLADIFCANLTAGVQSIEKALPKGTADTEKFRKYLFDELNHSFSKCLENAFPDYELRPELTEEAILRAENEILHERAALLDA